ncbi:demethylmenaquinone methyltransferase / 2-methoxy-6-polyprenyl-1,4-benzoquinol methylase [Dehalogenimonas formicexedens]|uniref:Demethylmenaquinone methyltransferase / 2-methoxy-6-polyprenyl-1,4-benzoquinol methylase n=1 Tax=Dehalogenimonas formicexedens TaxID=1839801 RepID=A0A1P8F4W8_9CHLR|nr:methyltransferase domain-containing protein [Dehalogenimonas formicexedens]APV43503.1 demethylmenaquinone methyltransferase / 2-methoxy-6-polyprenyl-1,4-benzoquinol methylase [Dehalogenimonas formicexedens]
MVEPKFFETIAPLYDFLTKLFMGGTYESMRKRMLNEDTSQMEILDLCCGTGYISNTINAKRIVGLDQSDAMLARNAKVKRPNKELIKGNAYQVQFKDGEFDRIYNSSASHEFKLFSRLLQKSYQALKPGGKIIIFDIYQPKNRILSFFMNTFVRYVVERGIMFVHTKEEWRQMLTEAGFEVEELESVRGLYIFVKAVKPLQGKLPLTAAG